MRLNILSLLALGAVAAVVLVFAPAVHPSDAADPPAFGGKSRPFVLVKPARAAPWKPAIGVDGKDADLGRFKGKVVLLNFWATWCAPCVAEMPTLDALQAQLGGDRFTVVALSIDGLGLEKVIPFIKDLKIKTLKVFLDRRGGNYRAFGVRGLPTTFLIDHEGRVVGYLEGPAEWASDSAKALIRYYILRAGG